MLETSRLQLIPLTLGQLELALNDLPALSREMGMPLPPDLLDKNGIRAIGMKIEKMQAADVADHPWTTYWLIVIRAEQAGAGLIGFKGYPNENGRTEIGYGIHPAYQNKGYMTEAIRALRDWAFSHPFCRGITATTVINPASSRVLEKLGAQLLEQRENETDWLILPTKKPDSN
jgi:[ribosomal protein S5]-alanine N-acetyltransferase